MNNHLLIVAIFAMLATIAWAGVIDYNSDTAEHLRVARNPGYGYQNGYGYGNQGAYQYGGYGNGGYGHGGYGQGGYGYGGYGHGGYGYGGHGR